MANIFELGASSCLNQRDRNGFLYSVSLVCKHWASPGQSTLWKTLDFDWNKASAFLSSELTLRRELGTQSIRFHSWAISEIKAVLGALVPGGVRKLEFSDDGLSDPAILESPSLMNLKCLTLCGIPGSSWTRTSPPQPLHFPFKLDRLEIRFEDAVPVHLLQALLSSTITSAKFDLSTADDHLANDELFDNLINDYAPNFTELEVVGTGTARHAHHYAKFLPTFLAKCDKLVKLTSDAECLDSMDQLSSTSLKEWKLGFGTLPFHILEFGGLLRLLGPEGPKSLKGLEKLTLRCTEEDMEWDDAEVLECIELCGKANITLEWIKVPFIQWDPRPDQLQYLEDYGYYPDWLEGQ